MIFIENEGSTYGYRKLTVLLRRYYNLIINKKKVYRICKKLDILKPQRKIQAKYPRKLARNRIITGSNQLWEMDIKYGFIHGEQRFFFILSIIDVYDRSIIDYHMGLSCTANDAVATLKRAMFKRQLYEKDQTPVIRTDNGPQFISYEFQNGCQEISVEHERIPPRTPNMNAHIESFHRTLQQDCFDRYEFRNYQEAYKEVYEFMKFYNEIRIHSSIKDLAPNDFYRLCLNSNIQIKEIRV